MNGSELEESKTKGEKGGERGRQEGEMERGEEKIMHAINGNNLPPNLDFVFEPASPRYTDIQSWRTGLFRLIPVHSGLFRFTFCPK